MYPTLTPFLSINPISIELYFHTWLFNIFSLFSSKRQILLTFLKLKLHFWMNYYLQLSIIKLWIIMKVVGCWLNILCLPPKMNKCMRKSPVVWIFFFSFDIQVFLTIINGIIFDWFPLRIPNKPQTMGLWPKILRKTSVKFAPNLNASASKLEMKRKTLARRI